MRGFLRGVFKIESEHWERYIDKTVVSRGVEVPITPRTKRERQSGPTYYSGVRSEEITGTYVTIFRAYEYAFRHISDEHFDNYFHSIEGVEIFRQTQPQYASKTNVLNNNRSIIVKNEMEDGKIIDADINYKSQ